WAADAFVDLPLGPGVITGQANVAQWNAGNTTFVALPKQRAVMAELGYTLTALWLSPIVRYERRTPATPSLTLPEETRYAGGVGFWPFGHTSNVKAFYVRVHPAFAGLRDYDQIVAQWQV